MFKKFLMLEWKAFRRSASFATNVAFKILMVLGIIYFAGIFLFAGIGLFYILREMDLDPLQTVSQYLIYYFIADLIIRLIFQQIPVMNIRPLLTLPIGKKTIVNFALGKTYLSFFNLVHFFFFIPFAIVLLYNGYDIAGVSLWFLMVLAMVYTNNFLNILLNNKDKLFYLFMTLMALLGVSQYYALFDITVYTVHFFYGVYSGYWIFLPAAAVYRTLLHNLYIF